MSELAALVPLADADDEAPPEAELDGVVTSLGCAATRELMRMVAIDENSPPKLAPHWLVIAWPIDELAMLWLAWRAW